MAGDPGGSFGMLSPFLTCCCIKGRRAPDSSPSSAKSPSEIGNIIQEEDLGYGTIKGDDLSSVDDPEPTWKDLADHYSIDRDSVTHDIEKEEVSSEEGEDETAAQYSKPIDRLSMDMGAVIEHNPESKMEASPVGEGRSESVASSAPSQLDFGGVVSLKKLKQGDTGKSPKEKVMEGTKPPKLVDVKKKTGLKKADHHERLRNFRESSDGSFDKDDKTEVDRRLGVVQKTIVSEPVVSGGGNWESGTLPTKPLLEKEKAATNPSGIEEKAATEPSVKEEKSGKLLTKPTSKEEKVLPTKPSDEKDDSGTLQTKLTESVVKQPLNGDSIKPFNGAPALLITEPPSSPPRPSTKTPPRDNFRKPAEDTRAKREAAIASARSPPNDELNRRTAAASAQEAEKISLKGKKTKFLSGFGSKSKSKSINSLVMSDGEGKNNPIQLNSLSLGQQQSASLNSLTSIQKKKKLKFLKKLGKKKKKRDLGVERDDISLSSSMPSISMCSEPPSYNSKNKYSAVQLLAPIDNLSDEDICRD